MHKVVFPMENSVAIAHTINRKVMDRFKAFYRHFRYEGLDELQSIYAQNVKFKDPLHELEGFDDLYTYFTTQCENLDSCRFVILDELTVGNRYYLKWDMHFKHKRLGNQTITVRGMSQLHLSEDRVVYHEDIYDLGALLYEHIPILGSAVKWLKSRVLRSQAP